MSVLGIVSAAAGVGGSILGGIFGNKRRKRARRRLRRQQKELKDWRDSQLQQNYLDRADSLSALRSAKDATEEQLRTLNTSAIKAGVSDQAKVAAAAKMNRNYAGLVSQLSGLSSQHKDRVNQQYLANAHDLGLREMNIMNDTSGVQNMVSSIANAAQQIASLYSIENNKKKEQLNYP